MAEGATEKDEKQNGQVNGTDAAAKKEAEANGLAMKDNSSISMGEGEEFPVTKGSRKREYIYITIAVILGVALIGVLIYFSVTNALRESEPKAVEQQGGVPRTTEELTTSTTATTTADTGFNGMGDTSSLLRNNPLLRRSMPRGGPMPSDQPPASSAEDTASNAEDSVNDPSALLRGNPLLRRMGPEPTGEPEK